jgi:hypothetical protein
MTPDEISKMLGAETIKKIYEDGLSKPTSELSGLITDFIKTIRLFAAPLQLTASIQDRIQRYLKEVTERVPKEKQIPAEGSFAGPIMERLVYIEDTNYLKNYYLNLLENAINSDRVNLAHPAFPNVIHQLSPDEIQILETLKKEDVITKYEYEKDEKNHIINQKVTESNFESTRLSFSNHRGMYYDHLQFLNLTRITSEVTESYNPRLEKYHRATRSSLSTFGELFMKACSR